MNTRTLLLFLLVAGRLMTGQAQTITGKITDQQQKPVEFATLLLLNTADSSMAKGVITDTAGVFELAGVKAGTYVVKVSSLGFQPLVSQLVTVADDMAKTELGILVMISDSKTLSEVIVKGERPVVERSLGKMTLNVSNSFFRTATDALDVIKRAPGLRVDQAGAISMRGGISPVVYIDGKQQPLTADELKNLSPDDIEQIEIIPNASAQYDGETRAVINIKLKRDKTLGWKGNAYAGFTMNRLYSGYTGGVSATLKTRRVSWYGRLGYGLTNSFLTMKTRRVVRDGQNTTVFNGDALLHYPRRPLSYQVSTDYVIAKNHSIGLMAKGILAKSTEFNTDQTTITESNQAGTVTNRQRLLTTNTSPTRKADIALDLSYSGKLNERGTQLTSNLDYAHYQTSQSQALTSYYANQDNTQSANALNLFGQFPATIAIKSAKVDLTHPFGNKAKLDLGAKFSHTQTDNELAYDTLDASGRPSRDLRRSNRFTYNERIASAYGQYSQEIGPISYNAGLRLEQTNARGNSITLNQVVNRNYLRWLPTAQVMYRLSDEQSLSVSYARKMTRPSFYDLNPFQLYVNQYLYSEGNPFLLPIRRNITEIAYNYKNISATASYTLDRDQFTQMPVQNVQTDVLYYTRVNLDLYRSLSFDLSASHTISKWWKTQNNLSVSYNQTKSAYLGGLINNQIVSYYLHGQQVFNLPNDFTLNVDYEYLSPTASQIYRTKAYGLVSAGLQKSVWQGQGTVQINVGDIFNTYREFFYGQYQDIDLTTVQKRNVQQGSFRFTYNFGKSTYKQKSRTSGSAEEEGRAR